jgi:hypothetical protein
MVAVDEKGMEQLLFTANFICTNVYFDKIKLSHGVFALVCTEKFNDVSGVL